MEVSSAERSRSVSAMRSTRSISSTRPHALDRQRALIAQRVQEPPLIGREQGTRLVAVDPHDADGAASGVHRQEQSFRAGQRVGAAAGGAIVFPRPFRRREIGLVEDVLRAGSRPSPRSSRSRAAAA